MRDESIRVELGTLGLVAGLILFVLNLNSISTSSPILGMIFSCRFYPLLWDIILETVVRPVRNEHLF